MRSRQLLRNLARAAWRAHIRFWAQPLKLSTNDRIFVVAPHADDETLGAGGLIAHACGRDIPVRVACINDGRFSHGEDLIDNNELIRLREAEFYSSLSVLGVHKENALWLGYKQEEPFDDTSWIDPTIKLIEDFNPTIVVLPDVNDDHPDHSLVGKILTQRIQNITILYMPIWHIVYGPQLRPRPYFAALRRKAVTLPIHDVLEKKRKAWENYATQSSQFREIENWNYLDEGFSSHHMNTKEIFFPYE